MWEVKVRNIGCWLLPTQTLFPACAIVSRGSRPRVERTLHHGEFLLEELEILDVIEFILVTLLGFMPLIIFHWADRRPHLPVPQFRPALRQDIRRVAGLVRALVLFWLTDNVLGIRK